MHHNTQEGKARILVAVVVAGILVIVGAFVLVRTTLEQGPLSQEEPKAAGPLTEVNNLVEQPDSAGLDSEGGDEQPLVLRSVNEQGSGMYISREKVDIQLPGKGSMKAYKTASPLNRKMRPGPQVPDRAKKVTPHPGGGKNAKGKPKEVDKTGGQTGGSGGDSGSSNAGSGMDGGT